MISVQLLYAPGSSVILAYPAYIVSFVYSHDRASYDWYLVLLGNGLLVLSYSKSFIKKVSERRIIGGPPDEVLLPFWNTGFVQTHADD